MHRSSSNSNRIIKKTLDFYFFVLTSIAFCGKLKSMVLAAEQLIAGRWLTDKAEITTRSKTEEGFLDVQATISRSGIYLYQAGELGIVDKDPAQIIRVLRRDEDVFKPESMASFGKTPVTDEHPTELVDSENARYVTVGFSEPSVIRDGDTVKTKLRITDKKLVDAVEAGKVELSCGYRADIELESGTDQKFGPFDAVQKNIRGNHIAIVKRGRAGDACRIQDKKFNDKKGVNTMILIFDGIQIDVTEQGKQAIDKLQNRLKDSATKLMNAETVHKTATEKMTTDHKAALDKLQGELDSAKEQVPDVEQLDKLVAERTGIVDSAKKLIKDFDPAGKSNIDIKKAVILHKDKDAKLDDVSDDYIDGRFSGLTTSFSKGDDNLNINLGDQGADGNSGDKVEDARNKHMADSQNAWKPAEQK